MLIVAAGILELPVCHLNPRFGHTSMIDAAEHVVPGIGTDELVDIPTELDCGYDELTEDELTEDELTDDGLTDDGLTDDGLTDDATGEEVDTDDTDVVLTPQVVCGIL
ncbi:hypothetical protein WICMUC_002914 [Wickerhamomyces mucosus]|uniref:Uncharacterized protein n=1 Tax=Wickerhamomyces mucosus TaxID=1378264 RepID=A0A9P8PND1_9ASCO|nr:hypothetical protein WICMUC_002914 [Wickerhamomyces mucosus]